MKAPFPWFGGKSRVANAVWDRFGDVPNYVEPFAGSLAVLLGRPTDPRIETVNDLDCWIANFWRALQNDPEAVAHHADWPVNEADLHARHQWLVDQHVWRERMKTDPDFFDVKIAGWWVWGISQWIGSGWCVEPGWRGRAAGYRGRGVNAPELADGWATMRKRPLLSGHGGSHGVHRKRPYAGRSHNRGVLSRQHPDLSGQDGASGRGLHSLALARSAGSEGLYSWLEALGDRLRRVRVCCGDWTRVLSPSSTSKIGLTAVFLDPPYDMRVVNSADSGRDGSAASDKLYGHHENDLSADVRNWAIEHGDEPLLRIALCGYEEEHGPFMPAEWSKFEWKTPGGYANHAEVETLNRRRERIWFSPACREPMTLFRESEEVLFGLQDSD